LLLEFVEKYITVKTKHKNETKVIRKLVLELELNRLKKIIIRDIYNDYDGYISSNKLKAIFLLMMINSDKNIRRCSTYTMALQYELTLGTTYIVFTYGPEKDRYTLRIVEKNGAQIILAKSKFKNIELNNAAYYFNTDELNARVNTVIDKDYNSTNKYFKHVTVLHKYINDIIKYIL